MMSQKNEDKFWFGGLVKPDTQFTRIPHYIIENLHVMSGSEVKVLFYLLRHTWGFSEFSDRDIKPLSIDEFMHGRKRSDGSRMDQGLQLSKPSILKAIDGLMEKGLLVRYIDNSDLARIKIHYRPRLKEDNQHEYMLIE
jgi:predicted transcriptional regulator